jgi:peroxiredoxin
LNVQILGIAATNPFSQKTFADSLKLPYPLLSDYPDPKVIRAYGVLRGQVAQQSLFLIDKEGIVRGQWFMKGVDAFPNELILKAAREIAGKP